MPRPISNKQPQYLLDSNYLIALLDGADVHHERAVRLYERLLNDEVQLFISDVLINEVLSVFAKRCEAKRRKAQFQVFAAEFQEAIKDLPILCLYELVTPHYKDLVGIMVRSQGSLSFHDALIWLFLREVPRVTLVSFDNDFAQFKKLNLLAQ